MRIKNFGTFLNEKKTATVKVTSTKEVAAKVPTDLVKLLKQAAEHNDKVQSLIAQLKAEEKTKELFDTAVMAKIKEASGTTIRAGKILALLKSKEGKISYSYTDAINILRNKLFELNQEAAKLCDQAIEALKKKNDTKYSVEYVKEGLLDDAAKTIKGWFAKWKTAFVNTIDSWTSTVDDLEAAVQPLLKESEQPLNENYGEVLSELETAFKKAADAMKGSSVSDQEIWIDLGIKMNFITEEQADNIR